MNLSIFYVFLATFIWSFSPFVLKILLKTFNASTIGFLRMFSTFIFFILIQKKEKKKLKL
ncbi:MAG: EamA family transporter [bacterium]